MEVRGKKLSIVKKWTGIQKKLNEKLVIENRISEMAAGSSI